jgi:hypothetical protein
MEPAAEYRRLFESSDVHVRTTALMRLACCLRKQGRVKDAIGTYALLSALAGGLSPLLPCNPACETSATRDERQARDRFAAYRTTRERFAQTAPRISPSEELEDLR